MTETPQCTASRRLWIVNQYATIPSRGKVCRHFLYARELAKLGISVTIFAGSNHHLHREPPEHSGVDHIEHVDGVDIIWVKTPAAVQHAHLTRLIAWVIFALRLVLMHGKLPRPTTILYSSPSLLPVLSCLFLSWRLKVPLIFEFRDIWPMTLIVLGKKSRFNPLIMVHSLVERLALKRAKYVLSTMEFGWRRLQDLNISIDKFLWLPNGVEMQNAGPSESALPQNIDAALQTSDLKLLYIGSMGMSNALDIMIEAAQACAGKPIQFYFVGNGAHKDKLVKKVAEMGLENVAFFDSVPKECVHRIMERADGLLITWHDSELYRYGTSANKLSEYLMAARPIIQAYSGEGDLLIRSKAGITVPSNDVAAFTKAILSLMDMTKDERSSMGQKGQHYAQQNLTFIAQAKKLAAFIK